jgi:hypothetical protein
MAFDFNKLFSRPKAEQGEQEADVIKKLALSHQDALHNIKVKHKDGLSFSDADNSEFGVIRLELAEKVGQDIAEKAISEYVKAELPSRLADLKGVLDRQPQLRRKLVESLARAMNQTNTDAISALEEVKAFIKVTDAKHYSNEDINQLCEEIIASGEPASLIASKVAAELEPVSKVETVYAPGVAPTLPKQTPHSRIGEPNLKWTPHTADDTLHNAPPTHMK